MTKGVPNKSRDHLPVCKNGQKHGVMVFLAPSPGCRMEEIDRRGKSISSSIALQNKENTEQTNAHRLQLCSYLCWGRLVGQAISDLRVLPEKVQQKAPDAIASRT